MGIVGSATEVKTKLTVMPDLVMTRTAVVESMYEAVTDSVPQSVTQFVPQTHPDRVTGSVMHPMGKARSKSMTSGVGEIAPVAGA